MRRRTVECIVVLVLSLLAAPYVAAAQQRERIPQIGWLAGRAIAEAAAPGDSEAFLHGLRDLGYVEGQNFIMVRRDAEGQLDRLPALVAELVRLPVDVIV